MAPSVSRARLDLVARHSPERLIGEHLQPYAQCYRACRADTNAHLYQLLDATDARLGSMLPATGVIRDPDYSKIEAWLAAALDVVLKDPGFLVAHAPAHTQLIRGGRAMSRLRAGCPQPSA
jgi:predicted anti-sigma-YlaC factor YlaD